MIYFPEVYVSKSDTKYELWAAIAEAVEFSNSSIVNSIGEQGPFDDSHFERLIYCPDKIMGWSFGVAAGYEMGGGLYQLASIDADQPDSIYIYRHDTKSVEFYDLFDKDYDVNKDVVFAIYESIKFLNDTYLI